MSREDRDIFNDPEKYGQLADKVEKLNKERVSLEKRIEELENRMTGSSDRDQMSYNFIVEKQTTQMQWNRERDSQTYKSEGKDGNVISPQRRDRSPYKDKYSSNANAQTEGSSTRGPVVNIQQGTDDNYPKAIIKENGEIVIIYNSPRDTPSGSHKSGADDKGKEDREKYINKGRDNLEVDSRNVLPGQTSVLMPVGSGKANENYTKSRDEDIDKSRRGDDSLEGELKDRKRDNNIYDRNNQRRDDGKDYSEIKEATDKEEDFYSSNTETDNAKKSKEAKTPSPEDDKDIEAIIPRVIVVTGFKQDLRDMTDEKPVCNEHEQDNCQCYRIMRESDEWKANVTRLLELLVMNAYGNRCPKSLIKALMDPSTREQAIKELLNRTFATDTISQDNLTKYNQRDSFTTLAAKNRMDKKDTSHLSIPKTFPQYPPYPKAFESKDSFPKPQHTYDQTATQRTGGQHSTSAGQGNKIDIVCPPGSRPIIHIPPSGSPAVTCDLPRSQNPRTNSCCSPDNPCERHR